MEEDLVWVAVGVAVVYTVPRSMVSFASFPIYLTTCVYFLLTTPPLSKLRFNVNGKEQHFALKDGWLQVLEWQKEIVDVPRNVVLAAYVGCVFMVALYSMRIIHRVSPAASVVVYVYHASALFVLIQSQTHFDQEVYGIAFLTLVAVFSLARNASIRFNLAALPIFAVVRYLPTTLVYALLVCVSHDVLLGAVALLSRFKLAPMLWVLAIAASLGYFALSVVSPFAVKGGSKVAQDVMAEIIPALASIYALSIVCLYLVLSPDVSWKETLSIVASSCGVAIGIVMGTRGFLYAINWPVPEVGGAAKLAFVSTVAMLSLPDRALESREQREGQEWKGLALKYWSEVSVKKKTESSLKEYEKTLKQNSWSYADTHRDWQRAIKACKTHDFNYKRAMKRLERLDGTDDSQEQLERRIQAIIRVVQCSRSYTQSAEEQAKLSREIADEIESLRNGYRRVRSAEESSAKDVLVERNKKLLPLLVQTCEDFERDMSKVNAVVQHSEEVAEQAAYTHRHHTHKSSKLLERLATLELNERLQRKVNTLKREVLKPLFKETEGKHVVTINLRQARRIPDSVSKYGDSHKRSTATDHVSTPSSVRRRLSSKPGMGGPLDRNGSLNSRVQVSPAFKEKRKPWWSRYSRRGGGTKER